MGRLFHTIDGLGEDQGPCAGGDGTVKSVNTCEHFLCLFRYENQTNKKNRTSVHNSSHYSHLTRTSQASTSPLSVCPRNVSTVLSYIRDQLGTLPVHPLPRRYAFLIPCAMAGTVARHRGEKDEQRESDGGVRSGYFSPERWLSISGMLAAVRRNRWPLLPGRWSHGEPVHECASGRATV